MLHKDKCDYLLAGLVEPLLILEVEGVAVLLQVLLDLLDVILAE